MFEILCILISITITGTLLFTFISLLDRNIGKEDTKWQCFFMKATLWIFFIPITAIVIMLYNLLKSIIGIQVEDFLAVTVTKFKSDVGFYENNERIIAVLFFVWVIGFLAFCLVKSIKEHQIIKEIILLGGVIEDPDICNILNELRKELKIKRKVQLYYSGAVRSPFLVGVIHPKIILTKRQLQPIEIALLLRHELIHYKKGDLFYNIVILIVQGMHWFNPFIRSFVSRLRDYNELSCDYDTLKNRTWNQRSIYAKLLVTLLEQSINVNSITQFASKTETFIERRVYHVMKFPKKKTVTLVITVALLVCSIPVISSASVYGVSLVQNQILSNFNTGNAEQVQTDEAVPVALLQNDSNTGEKKTIYINVNPNTKGVNSLDFVLPAWGEAQLSSIKLYNGSSVRIVMSGDKTTDKFSAGYMDMDRNAFKTYVVSSNGVVNHTFNFTKSGNYIIFFEGLNSSFFDDINLRGTVYVNY